MKVIVQHELKPGRKGGWFSFGEPSVSLVHVSVEATDEELRILYKSGNAIETIYEDYDPDLVFVSKPIKRERILHELLDDKPCTFVFRYSVQAMDFEEALTTEILPRLKRYLDRGLPSPQSKTFEL